MASPLTRFCVAISIFVLAVQAEQMLAIAPVTTLARREDSGKRPQFAMNHAKGVPAVHKAVAVKLATFAERPITFALLHRPLILNMRLKHL